MLNSSSVRPAFQRGRGFGGLSVRKTNRGELRRGNRYSGGANEVAPIDSALV